MKNKIPGHILPVIVLAQFAGTSLWFAGNAVVNDLVVELNLLEMFVGFITMAVQAGFIIGTLVFAFINLADRFSPVKVFLFCAIAGSLSNLLTIWASNFSEVMFARLFTGFFLAGIYPVGMKIASDWHKEGLGKALGYLVGALVLGTAFPHLLKYLGGSWPWEYVFIGTSLLSAFGGILLFLLVGDGPYGKNSIDYKFEFNTIFKLFKKKNFRASAFGYFGHMWELYTFWAFVPVMLVLYSSSNGEVELNIPLLSFLIIGIGGISCVIGGYLSMKFGSKIVAQVSLIISGICCFLIPFSFDWNSISFLILLLIWGFAVIPDSPQFSTLVSQSSDTEYIATGLTIVNSIGFALTIVSIQFVNLIWASDPSPYVFWLMFLGPIVGLLSIRSFIPRNEEVIS